MDLPTFDEVPVREAVLNAVAHRDYRLGGSIFVRQFAKRLEVVSPGGLPPGITPANIIDPQYPRNRRLTAALGRCAQPGVCAVYGAAGGRDAAQLVDAGLPGVGMSTTGPPLGARIARALARPREPLHESPRRVHLRSRAVCRVANARNSYGYCCVFRLAAHPDPQRTLGLRDSCRGSQAEVEATEVMGRGKNAKYMLTAALYAPLGSKSTYTQWVPLGAAGATNFSHWHS